MATIAILGAGGKMGCRLVDNLSKHDHRLLLVEISDAGRANLAQRGLTTSPQAETVASAEVVILALFGGVHARQAIVCALLQGPEAHYALGEQLDFAVRIHRPFPPCMIAREIGGLAVPADDARSAG